MSRAALYVCAALLLGPGCWRAREAPQASSENTLVRASRFLWAQQGDDGGWHSETHALLRSGQALTPFVLLALMAVPDSLYVKPPGAADRALVFIRQHVDEQGALGFADPDVLEYPNYATAYALRVLARNGAASDASLIQRMTRYLVGQQLTEARGFSPADAAYGGWGFGEQHLLPGQPGHADLSHSRRILEALREVGYEEPALYRKATVFLRLLQKHPSETRPQPGTAGTGREPYDGGFYYSPVVLVANKGGQEMDTGTGATYMQSYATATCDGLLALYAAGVGAQEEPFQQAARWLKEHPQLDRPAGIPEDAPGQWDDVMFFYHLAARGEAYGTVEGPASWQDTLATLLAAEQQPDGSFRNPRGGPNKEDDPLLATALAITALTHALR